MPEYVIHPLVVGLNETDQGVMTYLKGYGKRIYLPIYVFYLEGGPEKILVDTGLEQFMVPPGVAEELGLEILEFEDALAKYDLQPEDIDIIIHTHLHNDHCENDYKCTNARVFVQKKELEFFRNPHPIDHRYFPDLLDDVEVVTVEGDQEIVPGISVMLTPGHTPGGQSVVVSTKKGRAVITGFCCNDQNFPASGPIVPPGVHLDLIEAYDSVQRVKEAADILIPLHDLSVGRRDSIPE
ncbi:MAG: N-acyl homoserine lactonase family protein [Deltaproteobacteria bacterium]|nr:N-acyl homoserine lactonase family protein [Deltaproteobacteria bacterium]